MREIEFRGRRRDNKKWVYGLPCYNSNEKLCIQVITRKVIDGFAVPHILYEVDPDTIGQYTEREDEGGKRIYDGDLLEHKDEYGEVFIDEVFSAEPISQFRVVDTRPHVNKMWDFSSHPESKVIGNIHDGKTKQE